MNYLEYIKRNFEPSFKTIFSDIRRKRDPDEFTPSGSQIYHGYQGEGKTISMYYHAMKLKNRFPKALIVSNLEMKHLKGIHVKNPSERDRVLETINTESEYILFHSYEELIFNLRDTRRGKYGVIFMIDEIHNYFHSHDSKSMPMWVVQVFSQQRKQRLVVLGTVQDWEDVIKAIRRQIDNLIACSRFGYIIKHTAIDPRDFEMKYGEREAPVRKKGFFFISNEIRNGFDTYQVINSGREVIGGGDLQVNVKAEIPNQKKGWRR